MEFFKTTTTAAVLILCVLLMSCTSEQITREEPTPEPLPVPAEQTIPEKTPAHNPAEVFIRESFLFEPTTVTISAGQSVTWQADQDITEPFRLTSPLFVSETVEGNGLFTFAFEEPGLYEVEIVNQGQTMSVLVE